MAESTYGRLHIWTGGPDEPAGAAADRTAAAPAVARRHFLHEALLTHLRRRRELPEPYSFEWFLEAEALRYGRHGRWVPRLLEFGKHAGDVVLGLGCGVGTDWAQYARCGAEVIACGPSAELLELARRNFQLRGLRGRFVHASPAALPLGSASIDVACVTSLLHETGDPAAVVAEVYRVLRPGGKVLALAPAAYGVDFWLRGGRRFGAAEPLATAPGLTGRALRRLFGAFVEPRVYRRQLRRQDLPPLCRWAPLPLLERLVGRFLVLKAFKPVSAAAGVRAAA